jgi:hypothetical protein
MLDPRLMSVLNFTEDDLIANRDGYMTKVQRQRLRKDEMDVGYGCLIAGFLYASVILCPVIWSVSKGRLDNWMLIALLLVALLCLVLAASFFYWHRRNVIADLRKGNVLMVEGYVTIEHLKGYRMDIQIENVRFNITETIAFNEDSVYRIYYAPHTMRPLSAELVKGRL